MFASGCATTSGVSKNFKVITNPADASIKVLSAATQTEKQYSSPAQIEAELPSNPVLASKTVLEVSKEKYKPVTIPLAHIGNGDTLMIKLEKIVAYELKYKLLGPTVAEDLKFKDKFIAIELSVEEKSFLMNLTNVGTEPLKIRWQSAEYTDIFGQPRRLMHSGISYQNRNNAIPDQEVAPGQSLRESVTPIENVVVASQGKYEVKPLLKVDPANATALKGKSFNLFIPIEINRQIIPYNFKIEISGVRSEKPERK